VLSLGLLLILSCFFFGTFVYSDTKMNVNQTDEATNNEKATPTETEVSNEEVSNEEFSEEGVSDEKVSNEEVPITISIQSVEITESLINQLIAIIEESPDESWRKPANNRKNTMINKLNALKDLVSDDNLEDAYNKLFHEIIPKLTGLKTDENEETWGNGVFKNPWVICPDLQQVFLDILAPPQPH